MIQPGAWLKSHLHTIPIVLPLLPVQLFVDAGRNECSEVTPLALPASLGGHQSHIAAVLTSSNQHLEQQKQLNAALQVDISSIGKQQSPLLPWHANTAFACCGKWTSHSWWLPVPSSLDGQMYYACSGMTQCVLLAVAYRQSLVQQVAAGMQRVTVRDSDEQENVRPNGAVRAGHQDARLQLFPPTPVGTAPLQAAAASVAAKKGVPTHGGQSALDIMQGELRRKLPCLLLDARHSHRRHSCMLA